MISVSAIVLPLESSIATSWESGWVLVKSTLTLPAFAVALSVLKARPVDAVSKSSVLALPADLPSASAELVLPPDAEPPWDWVSLLLESLDELPQAASASEARTRARATKIFMVVLSAEDWLDFVTVPGYGLGDELVQRPWNSGVPPPKK